jgi:hypothetical protein
MTTHEIKPKLEIDQALLARVEEEMDEPRMSQSAREAKEQSPPGHDSELGRSPQSIEPSIPTEGEKRYGKARHHSA